MLRNQLEKSALICIWYKRDSFGDSLLTLQCLNALYTTIGIMVSGLLTARVHGLFEFFSVFKAYSNKARHRLIE